MSEFKDAVLEAVRKDCCADGRNIFEIVFRVATQMKVDDPKEVARVAAWAGGHVALDRSVESKEAKGVSVDSAALLEARARLDRTLADAGRQTGKVEDGVRRGRPLGRP